MTAPVQCRPYGERVAERVEAVDLGVVWEPNAPDAVLVSNDVGPAGLALRAYPGDHDERCVLLIWAGCYFASTMALNDEAISGHRLWAKGLSEILWAGVVNQSELILTLEQQDQVHPPHGSSRLAGLVHYVIVLKECVVEVIARGVAVQRVDGTTAEAALRALSQ